MTGMEIRHLTSDHEYQAAEQLQQEVWGAPEIEVVPRDLLLTAQKNGGLVLGAFDRESGAERLVGFVFGFVGLQPDGRIKLCSHMAGVAAGYRDRGVGYALKLAQREQVLRRGIELITWTFDPLESRNARFNFHKLGVTCRTYMRNHYGDMRDALNAGLPSDRFEVDWHLVSPRVEARLRGEGGLVLPSILTAAGVPLIDFTSSGNAPLTARRPPTEAQRLLVRIPSNFQQLKKEDRRQASAWREQTRAVFEDAFASGWIATDLLTEAGESFYLLEGVR